MYATMQSEYSRRIRGTGAVLTVIGIVLVILNIMHYKATEGVMLLLFLAGIFVPLCGIFMLFTGRAPFGK